LCPRRGQPEGERQYDGEGAKGHPKTRQARRYGDAK
jgi:hypothetical protein